MNPIAQSMFLFSLAIGTTITLFSHHWLLAWVGLEINTLAIIPMMTKMSHPRAIEAATKYFLMQAAASSLVLFSALMSAWGTGQWQMTMMSKPSSIVMTIALATKLGLAPLHFWMPEVIQGIPLFTGLILSTWQKIAPMFILLQMSEQVSIYLATSIGLVSIFIGGWGGINQVQTRKIMAFSSIAQLGWMVLVLKLNTQLTQFTFIMYMFMTTATFLSLMVFSSTNMMEISSSSMKTPVLTPMLMLTLLSLAGLPPLLGFAPKLLITLELTNQNLIILVPLALLASLLALFFYLRLTYIMIMLTFPNTSISSNQWYMPKKMNPFVSLFNTLSLLMLPMTPTMLLLM
uniref:NADH dehydrogenase subunit 2 n=1 Tax=Gracixalus yunnanensis TaxID=2596631 RepID=UPI001F13527D|nr:NADH dehydrogenase subunit 2 [Gracixalus yunnanensis]UMI33284.1 NADH dehydrogenase subunit 2 [Gracixalus yunnanensis]